MKRIRVFINVSALKIYDNTRTRLWFINKMKAGVRIGSDIQCTCPVDYMVLLCFEIGV